MKLGVALTILVLGLFASREASADAYTFTTISVPASDYTEAFGINDGGHVVGLFYNGSEQGFDYDSSTRVFTTIPTLRNPAFTLSPYSEAMGVNNLNQVVGSSDALGFLYSNGVFTIINVPGSINVPNGAPTLPTGINNAGQIVGTYYTSSVPTPNPPTFGFLDANGSFSTISVPGSPATAAIRINDAGQIVGSFSSVDFRSIHGFLDNNGVFTTIDVPGSSYTTAEGINSLGQIVGTFANSNSATEGFVDINGIFTPINVPGSVETSASGINNSGQIVGWFIDTNDQLSGFVATPASIPEPTSLRLLTSGLAGIAILILRRRRAKRA
jgi:probable HAF family extracellular repeat protein